jgi:cysteine desulfurase
MATPVYLDYAATTPVDPRVAGQMLRYLTADGIFGNPASNTHAFGRGARSAVEQAREQVAELINAEPREIIWTSGATEENNLAIKGAAQFYQKRGRHIVTCKTEHKAVLDPCRELSRLGFEISYLDPQPDGLIDLDKLAATLRTDTVLLSVMHVNNETEVIQDIAALARLARARNILLHVDAAQSAGKLPVDVRQLDVDLLSVCAHKIYGPKGIGALYVRQRPKVRLNALIHGGGQEHGMRAGTLATHQIAGMGEAFRIARAELAADAGRIRELRDRLWQGISKLDKVYRNGDPQQTVAGIVNVSFKCIAGEALLMALPDIAVSSGSACTSATQEPSHVLTAMGLSDELADSAIRFSLGRFTTQQEIDDVIAAVHVAVNRLREISPLWG